MIIHFLNVGHGDTTLIDFDGVYMLIDCKISGTDDSVFKYIDNIIPAPSSTNAKKKLDYVERHQLTGDVDLDKVRLPSSTVEYSERESLADHFRQYLAGRQF